MIKNRYSTEDTANLYCNFIAVLGKSRVLQYIFAVTSGSPSTNCNLFPEILAIQNKLCFQSIFIITQVNMNH